MAGSDNSAAAAQAAANAAKAGDRKQVEQGDKPKPPAGKSDFAKSGAAIGGDNRKPAAAGGDGAKPAAPAPGEKPQVDGAKSPEQLRGDVSQQLKDSGRGFRYGLDAKPPSGRTEVQKDARRLQTRTEKAGIKIDKLNTGLDRRKAEPVGPIDKPDLTHDQKLDLWFEVKPLIERPDDARFNFQREVGATRQEVVTMFKDTLDRAARYRAEDAKRPHADIDHLAQDETRLKETWDIITKAREGGVLASAVGARQLPTAADAKDRAKVRESVETMAKTAAALDGIAAPATRSKPGPAADRPLRRTDRQEQPPPGPPREGTTAKPAAGRSAEAAGTKPADATRYGSKSAEGVSAKPAEAAGTKPAEAAGLKPPEGAGARPGGKSAEVTSAMQAEAASRLKEVPGATERRVSPERYVAELGRAFPGRNIDEAAHTVDGLVQRIEDRAAQAAAGDATFLGHCINSNMTEAGKRFHTLARDEANKMVAAGEVPPGFTLSAEIRMVGQTGESRLDVFVGSPAGRYEVDWKSTVRSGLDSKTVRPLTGEMARHRAHVQDVHGAPLVSQESRSWRPAVSAVLSEKSPKKKD